MQDLKLTLEEIRKYFENDIEKDIGLESSGQYLV